VPSVVLFSPIRALLIKQKRYEKNDDDDDDDAAAHHISI
jgi:hypothetical protein